MNPASHLIQRVMRLDPPVTRDVIVQRDLRVPMPDGVDLLADPVGTRGRRRRAAARAAALPVRPAGMVGAMQGGCSRSAASRC